MIDDKELHPPNGSRTTFHLKQLKAKLKASYDLYLK